MELYHPSRCYRWFHDQDILENAINYISPSEKVTVYVFRSFDPEVSHRYPKYISLCNKKFLKFTWSNNFLAENNLQIFSGGYYIIKKKIFLFWSIISKSHETLSHTYRVIPSITFSEKPNTQKKQNAILYHINRDWSHCRICCPVYLRFKASLNYVPAISSSQSIVKKY